jgi:pyruvate formate lyase activating enzyme
MIGRISSFQSMGAVDGPGLRCVVFLQGCPLRCIYCHNPETWDPDGGQEISTDALTEKIDRFKNYIKNGGVTVSGGEALLQWQFTADLFKKLKEKGYHTVLDTSGAGCLFGAEQVLKYTDLVICDIKFTDAADFGTYCRGDLEQVYRFLEMTVKINVPLWIRQVIIPGVNDRPDCVLKLKTKALSYPNLEKIELLPFRKLCISKYDDLGIDFKLKDTPECSSKIISDLQKLL